MSDGLLWIVVFGTVVNAVLLAVILIRSSKAFESGWKDMRDELRMGREEAQKTAREQREELSGSLKSANDTLSKTLESMGKLQQAQLDSMTKQLRDLGESNEAALARIRTTFDSNVKELQAGNEKKLEEVRKTVDEKLEEMTKNSKEVSEANQALLERIRSTLDFHLKGLQEGNEKNFEEVRKILDDKLDGINKQMKDVAESSQRSLDRIHNTFDTQVKLLQEGNEKKLDEVRRTLDEKLEGMNKQVKEATEASQVALVETRNTLDSQVRGLQEGNEKKLDEVRRTLDEKADGMTRQLKEVTDTNQVSLERIRTTLDSRVKELQDHNEKKLDEMRKTVDEKLHDTLERRLGESFRLVSDRLESVHKGLGEMQSLATGVGDLKRVLTNVKTSGSWAEVQLGAILEHILAPGQYEKNVHPSMESAETVEYAVRLPGPKDDPHGCMWLPIDSKFPQEDYLRVQEATEKADPDAIQRATSALARTIRAAAKEIHDKYVNPPTTTDIAIMFLATEGLYAEVLRQPALVEELQQRHRVIVAGPTTLAAILCSFRLGFQTLAIEQRATEVWRVLGAVKTEFGKFGDVLDRVRRQLSTASRTIEETGIRSRAMERKLRSVEHLPEAEAGKILELPEIAEEIGLGESSVEAVADDQHDSPGDQGPGTLFPAIGELESL